MIEKKHFGEKMICSNNVGAALPYNELKKILAYPMNFEQFCKTIKHFHSAIDNNKLLSKCR